MSTLRDALDVARDATYDKIRKAESDLNIALTNEVAEHLYGKRPYTFMQRDKSVEITEEEQYKIDSVVKGLMRFGRDWADAAALHARFATAREFGAADGS